jgi:protein RecA
MVKKVKKSATGNDTEKKKVPVVVHKNNTKKSKQDNKDKFAAGTGNSVLDVMKNVKTVMGEAAGSIGGEIGNVERIPTGVYPFDLGTGGGVPRGKASIFYGKKSSGKTNLAILTIAMEQKINPHLYCVVIDVEKSYDPVWWALLGVDIDRLIVLKPTWGEEAVDMFEAMLNADDVSIILFDSLGSILTKNEDANSAEKAAVGGASKLIGTLMRKCLVGLTRAEANGRYPTPIFINQVRTKIGQMFGDPEYQPGGATLEHASGLTCRIYGKEKLDKTISEALACYKETAVTIMKHRVPIVSKNIVYDMQMLPFNDNPAGYVESWATLSGFLKDFGLIQQGKNKWSLHDVVSLEEKFEFKTQQALKEHLNNNTELKKYYEQAVIDANLELLYG